MRDFERIERVTRDLYGRSEKWRALKERALARKMVPAHICRAIGLSPSSWNGWKKDKMLPTWATLELLAAEIDRRYQEDINKVTHQPNMQIGSAQKGE